MARWLIEASALPHYASNFPIHGILTIILATICVAVVVSIVSSLCSTCHKKPKTPKSPPANNPSPLNPNPNPNPSSDFAEATAQVLELTNSTPPQQEERTVIEITPNVATHGPIGPTVLPASSSSVTGSMRRLSISLSTRLPDMMRASRREQKQQPLDAGEDTLWKKTIIMGEKCRVPSDDEDEGGVKNYRPKTPRSRPMSRTNSFVTHDAAPSRTSSFAHRDLNVERRGE